jgi:hypothetical protein
VASEPVADREDGQLAGEMPMLSTLMLWTLTMGCSQEEAEQGPIVEVPRITVEVAPEPKAKALSLDEQIEAVRALGMAGDHQVALTQVEALLGAHPEREDIWRLFEQEAIAAGQAQQVFDRLAAGESIGGQDVLHHLLRAELALASGLAPNAQSAARLVARVDADAAAALLALAAQEGAVTDDLPSPAEAKEAEITPADALTFLVIAPDAESAEPFVAAAGEVAGWRAALVCADTFRARGQNDRALRAYGRAAGADDPRAQIRGNLGRVCLGLVMASAAGPLDEEPPPTMEQVGEWASSVVSVGQAEGAPAAVGAGLDGAVTAYLALMRPDTAIQRAMAVHDSIAADAAEGHELVARANLHVARAALIAGLPADAHAAAAAARPVLTKVGDRAAAAEAAWFEGVAAYRIADAAGVKAAALAANGPRQRVLQALERLSSGDVAGAVAAMPDQGLDDADAAIAYMALGTADRERALSWLEKASTAAAATGDRALLLEANLALEGVARGAGLSRAAGVREQLRQLTPEGKAGGALRAEVTARALLDHHKGGSLGNSSDTALVGVWSALVKHSPPPAVGGDPLAAGVHAWAEARAKAAEGKPGDGYAAALALLPLHRQGPLSLGTVLDGSQGIPVESDLAMLEDMPGDGALTAALAAHEMGHRLDALGSDLAQARDLTAGLEDAARRSLLERAARARASMRLHMLGAVPYPSKDIKSFVEAEAAAASNRAFRRLLPTPGTTVAEFRADNRGSALLSYRVAGGKVHGLVITPDGGELRNLGSSRQILELADQHHQTLVAASISGEKTDHRAGDRLRYLLIDPFAKSLSGVGRYLIVAPESLLKFSFATFPEQSSGLRWLADIRNMTAAPSLRALTPMDLDEELSFAPNYLGIASPAAGALVPRDMRSAARQFGEFQVVVSGEASTKAAFQEHGARARFIHISQVEPAPDGGFVLADGALSLAEIRATAMLAEIVIITSEADGDVQQHRARAFMDAGVERVIFTSWPLGEVALDRLVDAFFTEMGRERPAPRAMSDARMSLSRSGISGEEMDDPGLWGAVTMFGRP